MLCESPVNSTLRLVRTRADGAAHAVDCVADDRLCELRRALVALLLLALFFLLSQLQIFRFMQHLQPRLLRQRALVQRLTQLWCKDTVCMPICSPMFIAIATC